MISLGALQQICGSTRPQIEAIYSYLTDTMTNCQIDTPLRMALFVAQTAQETGGYRWLEELASGEEYEGRTDLGNIAPGDGIKFKGRGAIQLTGRSWYTKCSQELFGDLTLIKHPELLAEPVHAAASAGWFWNKKNLSPLADAGDVLGATKRINGGTNGLADRMALYKRACSALGVRS